MKVTLINCKVITRTKPIQWRWIPYPKVILGQPMKAILLVKPVHLAPHIGNSWRSFYPRVFEDNHKFLVYRMGEMKITKDILCE